MSIDYNVLTLSKGKTRKQIKAKRARAEDRVERAVRKACVIRDGLCRVCDWENNPDDYHDDNLDDWSDEWPFYVSEWAHTHTKRRSQTRNQAPEIRHTTQDSLMLCKQHHDQYDGRQRPRLLMAKLTRRGCDGPLKFTRGRS